MAVGSAFDAFVKSNIYADLVGSPIGTEFEFEVIFDKQVEPHNRDDAYLWGGDCFYAYKDSGAYNDLVRVLHNTPFTMETTERRSTVGAGGVVLLGKPDLVFHYHGHKIILDWKVNGYRSKNGARPVAGYVDLKDGKGSTRFTKSQHKDAYLEYVGDLVINGLNSIELSQKDWARQLATYGWTVGVDIGSPLLVAVDQLVCGPYGETISVAKHRCYITPEFQKSTYNAYQTCWDIVQSNHIFRDMPESDSQKRCEQLLIQASAFRGNDVNTEWLREISGRGSR